MALKPQLCARFHKAVELIGSRWTGAVIQLLLNGRMRFAELRGGIPEISDRMLSERLRELEAEGIVARIVVPETPVRVEYELTDKGRALEHALAAVGRWAERWIMDAPPAAGAQPSTRAAHRSARASRPAAAASSRARR
ncbi:MAG TPA: winged helix-turn-helix transcriptional regulator [Vicinamibacterales bacterium]|jgi:DNA-binding HxlR family transcriptional regulator|nr:winged helix-turn-helix transcriptional regulator [Vicinamibacterales bacterium]